MNNSINYNIKYICMEIINSMTKHNKNVNK